MKNCDNCHRKRDFDNIFCVFTSDFKRPIDNICSYHEYGCECCDEEKAEYIYEGERYCLDCVLKEFEVQEIQITQYYQDGCFIGDDGDLDEVIDNLDGVKWIEEDC